MKKRVTYYINALVLDEFQKICLRENLIMSGILESFIKDFIDKKNNGEKK